MEDKEGQKELGSKTITGQKKNKEVQRKEGKTTQKRGKTEQNKNARND